MTTKHDNEPNRHGDDTAAEERESIYAKLDDFWKGYIGVVGNEDDPNYGKYRVSASEHGEKFADFLMEDYRRQQEIFAKYMQDKEQQQP